MIHKISLIPKLSPGPVLFLTVSVYAGIHLFTRLVPWAPFLTRTILPNAWLILVAYGWHRLFGLNEIAWQGGKKTALSLFIATAILGLNTAMALLWPVRQQHPLLTYDIAIVLLVPVAEELFFRGVLFDYFVFKTQRRVIAIIGTALIFGALHLPWGVGIATAMTILGLCLAWLASSTKTLIGPIVIHIGWNTLSTLKGLDAGRDRMMILGISGAAILSFSALGFITRQDRKP